MASLHKRGNFWYIKYYYQKKQFWIKTKLQHDIVSFENAMRNFTKLFGSDDLAKRTIYNHQRKIKRKQKIRSLMDLERISLLSHKFLHNQLLLFDLVRIVNVIWTLLFLARFLFHS